MRAWHHTHQQLGRVGHWAHWPTDLPLPIVRGTIIQVSVEYLPDRRTPPKDLWLFHAGPVEADLDLPWKAFAPVSGVFYIADDCPREAFQ
jgi:hypothetical protein